MEKLIEVLRRLADGARGPLVHGLIDEIEAEISRAATDSEEPATPAEGNQP